jgi:hypothetical protein
VVVRRRSPEWAQDTLLWLRLGGAISAGLGILAFALMHLVVALFAG